MVFVLSRRDAPRSFGQRSVAWLVGLTVPFLLIGGVATFSDRWLQSFWTIAPMLAVVLFFRAVPRWCQFWLGTSFALLAVAFTLLRLTGG